MTRDQILKTLQELNPRLMDVDLHPVSAALYEYRQAQANIDEFGVIVMHPRTGTPMENPYTVVRDRAVKTIREASKKRIVKTDGLWGLPPG
jgi:hypothetical protein